MSRFAYTISLIAGIVSVILWIMFVFFNPYTDEIGLRSLFSFVVTLLLPSLLAIGSSIKKRYKYLLIAFIWSFPISLYLTVTPGIFALFGLTNGLYLISFILAFYSNKKQQAPKQ